MPQKSVLRMLRQTNKRSEVEVQGYELEDCVLPVHRRTASRPIQQHFAVALSPLASEGIHLMQVPIEMYLLGSRSYMKGGGQALDRDIGRYPYRMPSITWMSITRSSSHHSCVFTAGQLANIKESVTTS
jgi:hypothetical protein